MNEDSSPVPPSRPNLLDPHLVRALAHPLRVQILEVLNERQASPNELMEILDYPLGNVAYHTRVLEKCGCIELVATERRRGAIEHYFRAKPRSYIGHQDWRKVPKSLRDSVTGSSHILASGWPCTMMPSNPAVGPNGTPLVQSKITFPV